jgi:hypothetical protein
MLLPYWPEPSIPIYKEGKFGSWKSIRTPILRNVPGYFTPIPQQPRGWMFKKDGVIWMSLTRMEVESQMMHIAAAKGHVVVGGLGMGFALFNIIRKPEVTKVTLLEVDPEIIQLMDRVTYWNRWPGYEKVEIVMGDARDFKPHDPVDYMFLDIWPKLAANDALKDTQTIQKNVRAASLGWWGQEFDLISYCQSRNINSFRVNRGAYQDFARDTNLPVTDQHSLIYPRLALLAVTLQTAANEKNPKFQTVFKHAVSMLLLEGDPIDRMLRQHPQVSVGG